LNSTQYKSLAVDLDGTLLNDNSEVTERTRLAVLAAMEQGVMFVPSTGRPLCGVGHIHAMFPGDYPFLLLNGALAVTGESKRVLFSRPLELSCAKEIFSIGVNRDIPVAVWADGKLYASVDSVPTREYQSITGVDMPIISDLDGIGDIEKLLWISTPEEAAQYQTEMHAHFGERVNVHTSRPYLLEFVSPKASKALALQAIGEAYGISAEEMIAVGDGYNDVSMLEYAGLGIAMGNAPEDIKALCQYTTLSNNEDGLAAAVERFLLP